MINHISLKVIVVASKFFSPRFSEIDTYGIMGVFDNVGSAGLMALVEEKKKTAEVS
jgi:hypothetical protein